MSAHLVQASASKRCAVAPSRPVLSSLSAFLSAVRRPPTPLARAIVTVLAIKLVAVAAMAIYFHFSSQHVAADAAAIGRLLGPTPLP
jgi:hypothetical protein